MRAVRLAVPVIVLGLAMLALAQCDPHFARHQAELARQYGVRAEDYQAKGPFPAGYFRTVLTPGTPLAEVHDVVQGYQKSYRCELDGLRSREVYYFFHTSDSIALRFEVWYDEQHQLLAIDTEDPNSRTILIDGCEEGRIGD